MIQRFFRDLKKYSQYSLVSAKSQLKAEVANSYLNWIWWFLDPICFMLIYTFMYGYVFNAREQYFSLYIFVGLTMWNFFSKTLRDSVKIIKHNKSIISKVYFHKHILILIKIWTNGFKMLVSFGIVLIMVMANRIQITHSALYAIPVMLTFVMLTIGCSCFLLHFGVYVEDLSNVINIALRVVLYLSGIFYHVEKRIPKIGAALNTYNPVAFLLTAMRQALVYGETPNLVALGAWLLVAAAISVAGIRTIYLAENSYVKSV